MNILNLKAVGTVDGGRLDQLFAEFHKFGYDGIWQEQISDLNPASAHEVIAKRRAILRTWFLRSLEDDDYEEDPQYVDLYRMVDDLLAAIQTALIASATSQINNNNSTDFKQ